MNQFKGEVGLRLNQSQGVASQGLYSFSVANSRVPRAKRAGPEETEVDSGQVTSEIRDKRCTSHGGEVWHHLYTLNFRCLGSRERSERGPRRRKFKVYKRCRLFPHSYP
ncbi:hypothetical protein TYRP_023456 [Tyrophagus putrescentiae]|nr:hypothetical protein TYRP_023456 [Tyrophagus putrescentiae]